MSDGGERSLSLSVAGKTFFVGEYLALDGGPSILVTTAPRFELRLRETPNGGESEAAVADGHMTKLPFAHESPAGRYFKKHHPSFRGYQLEFRDPHSGKGGLGASTAQFASLYAFVHGLKAIEPHTFDWRQLLIDYRDVAWDGEGAAPSGADLVAQLSGNITWFDGKECKARSLGWKFPFLDFTLVRTGVKLATHEHLRKHQAAPCEALRGVVKKAAEAFETGQEGLLITSVQEYAQALSDAGFVADGTREILRGLSDVPAVRAAKGCGAMGADIVLVLHDKDRAGLIRSWAKDKGLTICGTRADLSPGLLVKENS